jgi:hypothetical protein
MYLLSLYKKSIKISCNKVKKVKKEKKQKKPIESSENSLFDYFEKAVENLEKQV